MKTNNMTKIENYLSDKINRVGLLFIVVLLLVYAFNNRKVEAIYLNYSNDLKNDIKDFQEKNEKCEAANKLLLRNTDIIGSEISFISKLIKNEKDMKVAAVSHNNESVYARSRMNGIIKTIINQNIDNVLFYYITDYEITGTKIPNVTYLIADSSAIGNSQLSNPAIIILTKNNKVLQSFTIYDSIDKDQIFLIINIIKSILIKK